MSAFDATQEIWRADETAALYIDESEMPIAAFVPDDQTDPDEMKAIARARLASAAPDMARVLPDLISAVEREDEAAVIEANERGREALRKAGVRP